MPGADGGVDRVEGAEVVVVQRVHAVFAECPDRQVDAEAEILLAARQQARDDVVAVAAHPDEPGSRIQLEPEWPGQRCAGVLPPPSVRAGATPRRSNPQPPLARRHDRLLEQQREGAFAFRVVERVEERSRLVPSGDGHVEEQAVAHHERDRFVMCARRVRSHVDAERLEDARGQRGAGTVHPHDDDGARRVVTGCGGRLVQLREQSQAPADAEELGFLGHSVADPLAAGRRPAWIGAHRSSAPSVASVVSVV